MVQPGRAGCVEFATILPHTLARQCPPSSILVSCQIRINNGAIKQRHNKEPHVNGARLILQLWSFHVQLALFGPIHTQVACFFASLAHI